MQVDLISLIAAEEATYDWALHELPVEHVRPAACSPFDVGERVIDLTDQLGPVTLPVNRTLDLSKDRRPLFPPRPGLFGLKQNVLLRFPRNTFPCSFFH